MPPNPCGPLNHLREHGRGQVMVKLRTLSDIVRELVKVFEKLEIEEEPLETLQRMRSRLDDNELGGRAEDPSGDAP